MSSPYLFDNAVLDRHAKIANGLPVDDELVFAGRLWWLVTVPKRDEDYDADLLDSFLARKRVYADQRGGIHIGVLFIVVLVAGGLWGWTHSSSSPNGATLLGIAIVAVGVSIIATFGHLYRRAERKGKARTARIEKRLLQDTSGDHIWDA